MSQRVVVSLIMLVFLVAGALVGVEIDQAKVTDAVIVLIGVVMSLTLNAPGEPGNLQELFKSPRFWTAVGATLFAVFNDVLGVAVDEATIQTLMTAIAALLMALGVRGGGDAQVSKVLQR